MIYQLAKFADKDFPFHIEHCFCEKDSYGSHAHDFSELSIIIGGCASHLVEGQAQELARGDIFLIPPHFYHEQIRMKELDYYNIMFDLNAFPLYQKEISAVPGGKELLLLDPKSRYLRKFYSHCHIPEAEMGKVGAILEELLLEYTERKTGYQIRIRSYFLSLLLLLARHTEPRDTAELAQLDKIIQSLDYMEKHYAGKISLDELAAISFLSKRQYSRIFQSVYSMTPMEYLRSRRIQQACALLRDTHAPLSEIASVCGFTDSPHLSRCFLESTGLTPGEYRKRLNRIK